MAAAAAKGKLNNSFSSHQHRKRPNSKIKTVSIPSLNIFAEHTINKAHRHSLTTLDPQQEPKKSSIVEGKCKGAASSSKSALNNLEKKKGKLDNSGKPNVRRKVLVDISNVRASLSTTKAQDKSKSLYSSRNSLAGTRTGSFSSRKPLSGLVTKDLTQVTSNHQTLKKGSKETKATSDECRIKTLSGQLVKTTNSSTYGRHHPPPTRKSLPAIKQDNKEFTEKAAHRNKVKYGLPVNSNANRAIASQANSSQSHSGKTQVSDGCIVMASKSQSTMGVGVPRRSIKVMRTMRMINSKTVRTSNTRSVSSFNRPPAAYDISSKKTDEKAKLSSTGNTGQEEVSSFSNSHSTTAENVPTRKSGRRKSFTSMLTSRSKEELPNIYDAHNHLEVAEYIDDIYQYYWVMEAQNQPMQHYMDIQTEITPQMRGILINWLIEVHLKFDLMQETLFLMVTLLDQFLSRISIKKNEMQLVGLTALLLASKYEDFWHPRIMDLIGISADSYTREEMLVMENTFLRTLKFRLNAPTPYVFMLRFIKAAQSNKTFEHLAFYLIELCLVEYEALKYKPSLLCASAIYLARCTMQIIPTWTALLQKHTGYEEDQIKQCAEMIFRFQKAAKTNLLRVTYEKFMKIEFSRVAAMNPLEKFPQ